MGTRTVQTPTAVCITDKASSGVPRLLEDLNRLSEDRESCDIVFVAGRDDIPLYAHRLILRTRCTAFQDVKRGEVCKVPGTTVKPTPPGQATPIKWPQVKAEILKEVVKYIYSGRIVLQVNNVFECLAIAHELGIDELRKHCEDHILSTLNIHNACIFLPAALELEARTTPKLEDSDRTFVERCTTFIGENAMDCSKSVSFLNLPKAALIHLISSDHLALDEEDVWRAVLSWAKHQAGVTQPTAHWSEEERQRVCTHLSPVINHVRILLIDSQVFAEEVEPTGCVPMEISLERYRFAALASKYQEKAEEANRRVQPRSYAKLFNGTKLLADSERLPFQKVLNNWYGNPKQSWQLLYRASTSGFSSDQFHRHCDGHSPTFVLVLCQNGNLCGGYTDIPWARTNSTRGKYVSSDKSFLFSLVNNSVPTDQLPQKLDVKKKMFAVAHHNEHGPVFGAGADLSISSNCSSNDESYSNLGHSYMDNGIDLMGDYNFVVQDYEVFTVVRK